VILNDWLKAEFAARAGRKRKIEITNKLTVALRKLAETVAPEDEEAEKTVLSAPMDSEEWSRTARAVSRELSRSDARLLADALKEWPRSPKIPLTWKHPPRALLDHSDLTVVRNRAFVRWAADQR
jgi:hypothetical protein